MTVLVLLMLLVLFVALVVVIPLTLDTYFMHWPLVNDLNVPFPLFVAACGQRAESP